MVYQHKNKYQRDHISNTVLMYHKVDEKEMAPEAKVKRYNSETKYAVKVFSISDSLFYD